MSDINIRGREKLKNNGVYNKEGPFYTGLTCLRGYEILKRKLMYSEQR